MNILIFNWRDLKHSWAGGGEIYIFELAKRWVKAGHHVTVFCSQDPYQKLKDKEKYSGIEIIRKGNRFTVYFWAPIYYLIYFKNKFDFIVDIENGIPFFTPLFSRLPKLCFVYHIHGRQFFFELPPPLSYIGFFVERLVFPFIYTGIKVVAISKTTKKDLIKIGFKESNVKVVYSGITKPNNKNGVEKKFSSPTLLYLGRIKAYKRVDLLVDIFKDILKNNPRAKLKIAGWGTEASGLTDIIMRGEYRRKIHILGPVSESEKRKLLSKSWLFVNPSIGEGWSIAVIEANAYGTPAVAFKVPGLSESIKHGYTGLLARSKKDMIEKINKILRDKSFRERISKNAKNWAQQFNWEKTEREIMDVIKSLRK